MFRSKRKRTTKPDAVEAIAYEVERGRAPLSGRHVRPRCPYDCPGRHCAGDHSGLERPLGFVSQTTEAPRMTR